MPLAGGERGYRLLIARHGRLAVEWNRNAGPDIMLRLASAAKSIYSNILGIALDEGKLLSADAKVVDYYPEFMDVPAGTGPKDGRHAFEKDRDITFRQLICNTSGYMKPDEPPGKVFHNQTFGMNILTHSLAKIYGMYDIRDPEGSPGFKILVEASRSSLGILAQQFQASRKGQGQYLRLLLPRAHQRSRCGAAGMDVVLRGEMA